MNILRELRSRFEAALEPFTDDASRFAGMVRVAQDSRFGDFQANCAMPLAKQRKTNPRELAAQIVARLAVADLCQMPEIAGPGFINLRLRDEWLESEVTQMAGDERLGVPLVDASRTIVIDFSAPNVAKPMHVGHLRSTVIGDALCRILKFLGHTVIGDNHIGDWGTQFGMIIFGYKKFRDDDSYKQDPVKELARLYKLVNQLCEYELSGIVIGPLERQIAETTEKLRDCEDKKAKQYLQARLDKDQTTLTEHKQKRDAVDQDAELSKIANDNDNTLVDTRQETSRLHAGDEENNQLWNEFIPSCLEALQGMYDRLDVHFDKSLGESFYQPMLADVVADLVSKEIAQKSEGAICVFLEDNAAPFIVRKQDRAFTYATTDLATIKYRIEQFHADTILYVVDARQSEHFRLLFGVAKAWEFAETEFRHVSFGTILDDNRRPFKTRSGGTVGLESLIDEAVARARQIVDNNDDSKTDRQGYPAAELDDGARAAVAEIVGIGGIKYADLRHNRESDYVFSWDKMLATTGDTATYMQYAYARVCGIFRRGKINRETLRAKTTSGSAGEAGIRLRSPAERALALQLARFAEAIDDVAHDYRPNILTAHLFELANCYSRFYDECPVLKETDDRLRTSRLLLCDLTARVLGKGLGLLGIQTTEQM